MSNNEQTPVLIITPENMGFVTSEENKAAQVLGEAVFSIVEFVESSNPKLYKHEAMFLASLLLKQLFVLAETDPEAMTELQEIAEEIIKARN